MSELVCNGIRIPDRPEVFSPRIRRAIANGRYERIEASALKAILRPGDRVMELGAGIGYLSTLAAQAAEGVRVIAYEADPRLSQIIGEVYALNGVSERAAVRNQVLTPAARGRVPFYLRENFWSSSLDPAREGVIEEVSVETAVFPTALAETRPDVFLCDIEGGEGDLLPAGDYASLRTAIVEIHTARIGAAAIRAVFDAFHGQGLAYDGLHSRGDVVVFQRMP